MLIEAFCLQCKARLESVTSRSERARRDRDNISQEKAQPSRRGRPSGGLTFPRDTFKRSIAIAESIEKNNAGKPYDRLDLAKSLNWSPNSSGFRQLITSSGRYGLTEGSYSADKITLTSLGSSIVAPTTEEEKAQSLREALLTPDLFRKVAEYYDRKMLPKEELFKNTLRKEFGVPVEDVESCYEVLMGNLGDYGIVQNIRGNEFLQLDKLAISATNHLEVPAITEPAEGQTLPSPTGTLPTSAKPQVFISHSKNKKILDQLKQMLEFGGFGREIAAERETTAIPIPDKVFGLMRKCNCAVINVSADEQEKQEEKGYRINQNVLIEIGAAFLQYDKRVILLVDKRVQLPSNLQGLNALYYEGDELSWEIGMRLQKALTEFRSGVLS
jgi:predicted nucleotide-binding protein